MDYNPSVRPRRPARNNNNYHGNSTFNEYENDDFEEENVGLNQRYGYQDDDEEEDDAEYQHGYYRVSGGGIDTGESSRRHQKKRRLDNLVSNYEFAPRANLNPSKEVYGGGVPDRSGDEWSENATFVLLEVWGDRYLQLGRKSLRGDDWGEVAEKVSEMCKMEINETQCRNRLETLKKKYKKEKAKMEDMGIMGGRGSEGYHGKWGFFKRMDMLLSPKKQHNGLPCGVDSGEYVFMNTKVYLNQSNALDEMRDSPGESESDNDDDSDERKDDEDGFRVLAESVQNFGEIYEKIEGRKRQQMMELEKMRMDFQRELELQKKQIFERAQEEIAKIREGDDEDGNSVENLSG